MSKRKLLLADDSITIQKVVNLTFADEGIDVITVGDGDSAMETLSQIVPDVILADVHMPGLNGYQICERVRNDPTTHDLPVVLLVGSFEPFDESEAQRVGANAYLTKPFQSIRQLVSQVTDLMETATPEPEEQVAEFVPTSDLPDTSDIDVLYERSFVEPESDEAESGGPRYVDAGMDDEMIETVYAQESGDFGESASSFQSTGYDEGRDFQSSEYAGHESAVETSPQPETEYGAPAVAEMTGPQGEYGEPSSPEQPQSDYDHGYSSAEPETTERSPFDSTAGDVGAAAATASAAAEPESYFEQYASTEQIPAIDIEQTIRDFALDEAELLELPPVDNGAAGEPKKEVVSLSPELMDAIVQKVVEKLSDKH